MRLLATVVLFGLLVLGTWRGDDDHFPFGPFRMYASRIDLDAPTTWLELQAVTVTGARRPVPDGIGLRRAELEARLDRFRADPGTLAPVLVAYRRAETADASEVRGIVVVQWVQAMHDGRPQGAPTSEDVVAWPSP